MRTNSEARRILIIDDERPILLTLEALLTRHGYRTETAYDGDTRIARDENESSRTGVA